MINVLWYYISKILREKKAYAYKGYVLREWQKAVSRLTGRHLMAIVCLNQDQLERLELPQALTGQTYLVYHKCESSVETVLADNNIATV